MFIATIRRAAVAVFFSLLFALVLAPALIPDAQAQPLNPRGEWSPGKQYFTDDLVTSRGSSWRAKRNNVGKVPGVD